MMNRLITFECIILSAKANNIHENKQSRVADTNVFPTRKTFLKYRHISERNSVIYKIPLPLFMTAPRCAERNITPSCQTRQSG